MKKVILTLLAVGSIAVANAQPGSILLYGNVGITSQTDAAKTNNMAWNVNPGVGYQFNENWTVGLNLGWSQTSTKDSGRGNRYTVNNYNVGPFLRYTHSIGNGLFYWFGQLNLGYMGTYSTFGSEPSFNKANGFNANIMPAVGINLGQGYALNFGIGGLGFSTLKESEASNSSSDFSFTFGQQFNVGLSKNFNCHHMHGHHEPGDEMRHMDTSDDDNAPKKGHHHKKDKDSDDE